MSRWWGHAYGWMRYTFSNAIKYGLAQQTHTRTRAHGSNSSRSRDQRKRSSGRWYWRTGDEKNARYKSIMALPFSCYWVPSISMNVFNHRRSNLIVLCVRALNSSVFLFSPLASSPLLLSPSLSLTLCLLVCAHGPQFQLFHILPINYVVSMQFGH